MQTGLLTHGFCSWLLGVWAVNRDRVHTGEYGALAAILHVAAGVAQPLVLMDPLLGTLLTRRTALVEKVADIKLRKATLTSERYMAKLARLIVELAQVSRKIRRRMAVS